MQDFVHYSTSIYEARLRLNFHYQESLTGTIYWLLCTYIRLIRMCLIRDQHSNMTHFSRGLMLSFVVGRAWILELWFAGVVAISVCMSCYATDQVLASPQILLNL